MKVANSYASLLRGVSQQVPQDRAEGQHTAQVNMLSDPVSGLTRRPGSVWQWEKHMTALQAAEVAAYEFDSGSFVSYDFDNNGKEYVIAYRTGARPVSANPLPLAIVYNKTDKVFLTYTRAGGDTLLDSLEQGGVSAITGVGKYLFLAGNTVPTVGSSVESWNNATNYQKAVVWVRSGAYSRTFKVTVRLQSGVSHTVSYTTPPSSYQGVLTTADIPYAAADYAKQVNDRVNSYNGAVTAWIGTATAAIQPAAIAAQLKALLDAVVSTTTLIGSHICFPPAANIKSIDVDDGGDGTLLRAVADEIELADKTSVVHSVGKVVKVRGKTSTDSYYLKAVPKDATVTSGYTEVTWVEGAGVTNSITTGLFYATIVGSNFYIASDAAILSALTAGPHPTFSASTAGDADSAPMPYFVNRKVTYLGTFQNRLLVGAGGTLAVSETDDYLNFFRTTVLTLPASDPFEMLPQGSEDDELQHSTLYDQDLVIFGKRRQYVISGSVALTPTSANMPVMASYENVAEAGPVSAGGFIFYAKRGVEYSNVFQIQPGQNDKSPESFPASSQVDSFIAGGIVEMASFTGSPSILFARTDASKNSLYTFTYLDKQDGRKMDAWSRWDFNPALGYLIGMSVVPDGVLTLSLRIAASGKVYTVADFCPAVSGSQALPFLDSQRQYSLVSDGTYSVTLSEGSQWAAAFDYRSARRYTGTLLPNIAALQASYPGEPGLIVGALQEAYFTPTNPYMRDGKEKAILSGRLTVGRMTVAYSESSGFTWNLGYRNSVFTDGSFNGRTLGDPVNLIGVEPVSTGQHTIPVGRETRDYTLTIEGRRWYPLTVTALEWSGQFFNRVQRF